MALTRACGAMCSFCYAMVQEPQERASIKTKNALDLLDDFREIGVKGVSLISDGESTFLNLMFHLYNTPQKLASMLGMQRMVGSGKRKK